MFTPQKVNRSELLYVIALHKGNSDNATHSILKGIIEVHNNSCGCKPLIQAIKHTTFLAVIP